MDILSRLNEAIVYIENHLCGEIDMNEIAKIACESADGFQRIFKTLTSMTVKEYIRKRRLSLAVSDIQNGDEKIIDIALKYGYESADSFRRAFESQHKITPTAARNASALTSVYPPLSFHIKIKGAEKMNFKIVESDEIEVYGVSRIFGGQASERFEQEHIMWTEDCDCVSSKICEGYDGTWYGIWNGGTYMIAREEENVQGTNLEKHTIPAGTYAVFITECGGYAGDELPKLHDLIFSSWLPSSPYRQKDDYELEVYHLWTDRSERRKKRYYEIRIPVEKV